MPKASTFMPPDSTENRESEILEEVNGMVVPAVVLPVREKTVEQEIIAKLCLGIDEGSALAGPRPKKGPASCNKLPLGGR